MYNLNEITATVMLWTFLVSKYMPFHSDCTKTICACVCGVDGIFCISTEWMVVDFDIAIILNAIKSRIKLIY